MSITAILLAAGYATRLYPLTQDRPKALLPLGNHVILDETLRSVKTVSDVRHRILVTNHRFAPQFIQWRQERRAPIEILDDGTDTPESRLGAIRDLELARRKADPADDLLVVGTDNLFHWPLSEFVENAQAHRPDASLALWQAPSRGVATQFGVVVRDATSRVIAFEEKSSQPPSAEVALCVYYFPASMGGRITQFLNGGGHADAPGYFIKWLVQQGNVFGIMMPGAWYDIGTLDAYQSVLSEWPSTH